MPKTEQEVADEFAGQLLADEDPNERGKILAFAAPSTAKIEDYTFHAFNCGRKLLLILAGLDQKIVGSFTKLEQAVGADKLKDLPENELGAALLAADPEAYFHFAALAFICVKDGTALAPYRARPDSIEPDAFAWQDGLAEDLLAQLINRSAIAFFQSTIGQDFQVASDGRPPDPNGLPRAGSRRTPSPSAGAGLPKTRKTRSGAKSPSAVAGSISTPISP